MEKNSYKGLYRDSPGNAEIERLVAKLDTLRAQQRRRITLITCALTGEGKSTVASLVARSVAHKLNTPTLLVDFDIRRPTLHRIFNVKRERGLSDILSLNLTIKNCLKQTAIPNLVLLTSGHSNENPNDLMKSDKILFFLKSVRVYFENIIIDSPPVIPVSDPLMIGKQADNVILVIKAGETVRSVVKRAIDMFADIDVKITGIVMNNMNCVMPYQYDYRYYGYQYTPNGK